MYFDVCVATHGNGWPWSADGQLVSVADVRRSWDSCFLSDLHRAVIAKQALLRSNTHCD